MSKGGGGGGTTTSVQKADPWVGLQGPLKQLYSGAQDWYNAPGPNYYPGSTVAPQNDALRTSLQMGVDQSLQGENPIVGQGNSTLSNTIGGQYLTPDSNPFLKGQYEAATRPLVSQFQTSIAPAIGSQFSAAGRTGSGAHAAAFGQATDSLGHALGDTASNMYGNAYNNERNLQQAATLAAPAYAKSKQDLQYDKAAKLFGIGQFQQQSEQDLIDAAKARYDYSQNLPLQKLQALNQMLQGGSAYNSTSSSGKTNTNRNPFAGAVGGTMLGQALNSSGAGFGPAGLLGGLVLGGLFG